MKAKPILVFSLLLNLLLMAGGVMVYDGQKQPAPAPAAVVEPRVNSAMAPKVAVAAVETAPAPAVRSLSWNDLVSGDTETYARNLRAIGCPEETIRDILTAALAHGYDAKRQEVMAQYQQGRIDKLSMDTAVSQLWDAQNAAVNQVPRAAQSDTLAPVASAAPAPATASAPGESDVNGVGGLGGVATGALSPDPAIRMPLALGTVNPALGLSAAQQAAVDNVGDQFAKTVNAAANLAPTDPAYHQLWQDAQSDADQRLEVQIGWEAYMQLELQNQPHK